MYDRIKSFPSPGLQKVGYCNYPLEVSNWSLEKLETQLVSQKTLLNHWETRKPGVRLSRTTSRSSL